MAFVQIVGLATYYWQVIAMLRFQDAKDIQTAVFVEYVSLGTLKSMEVVSVLEKTAKNITRMAHARFVQAVTFSPTEFVSSISKFPFIAQTLPMECACDARKGSLSAVIDFTVFIETVREWTPPIELAFNAKGTTFGTKVFNADLLLISV